MSQAAPKKHDERFAPDLLRNYFDQTDCNVNVFVNTADPPDLLTELSRGDLWGIEVVRAYRQVADILGKAGVVSSEATSRLLEALGRKIGDDTKAERKRDYSLFLSNKNATIFCTQRERQQPFKDWERNTIDRVRAHIVQDSTEMLRGPGFTLTPGSRGTRWSVFTSAGVHETEHALNG